MADLFGDIPVYGQGSAWSGAPATPQQQAYARANQPYRDPNAPAGTPTNPSYDTPDITGSPDSYHVTAEGVMNDPNPDVRLGLFDDVPTSAVGGLNHTTRQQAALDAFLKRDVNQESAGPANQVMSGVAYNFLPEVSGAAAAVDTAVDNLGRSLTGKPKPYGASDAFNAQVAITRDLLARMNGQPGSVPREIAGALMNPASRLGAEFVREGIQSAPGVLGLARGMGRAATVATPVGAAYGAGANPEDRLGGAVQGGLTAAGTAAVLTPVGAAVGAAPGVVQRLVRGPQAAVGATIEGLTPAEMQAAQNLRIDMADRGVNISVPEAVQQVTGGRTLMGRSLRVLEGTRQGQEMFGPYFAGRPQQIQGAVTSYADRIAPPTDQPSVIGLRAGRTAERAVLDAEQARTAAAQPHYDAANPQHIPTTDMQGILADLDREIAQDRTGLIARPLSQLRNALGGEPGTAAQPRVPVTDIENLDRARKYFRDRLTLPQIAADAFTKEQAARVGDYLGRIDSLMEGVPAFRQGKQVFQQATRAVVDPVTAGPLGTMARTTDVGAHNAALYPTNPLAGAPAETSAAMAALDARQPGLSADLTRQHILQTLNSARPYVQSGPNAYVGSNFANRIAGNPEQQATLLAGISQGAPRGGVDALDMQRLLEGLRATGMREAAGSKTAYNAEDIGQMHTTKVGKVIRRGADPLEWGAGLADLIDRANWRRNLEGMARVYMAPSDQTVPLLTEAQAAAPGSIPLRPTLMPNGAVAVPMLPSPRRETRP